MAKGFTLIELSIVLVIIGLLIGGILVGQSLIESTKLKKLQRTIVDMEIITRQFYQKYRGLPGDTNKLPNGGNNDGAINYTEYRKSFLHLAQVGMLPEKYKNISISMTGINYDTAHDPKDTMLPTAYDGVGINFANTEFAQGFTSTDCVNATDYKMGNYFHIEKLIPNDTDSRYVTGHWLRGEFIGRADYLALDKKMDDGNARNGKLWAYGDGGIYANANACTMSNASCNATWKVGDGFYQTQNYDAAIPTCGILYWYDYK